ncbi:MAG: primosomal protein N' [Patescibacteria group bacterium]
MPKNLDYFDYRVPFDLSGKIKLGQEVIIPFRNLNIRGIVYKFKDATNYKNIREIKEIVQSEPVLTAGQIKLATFVSDYYLTSLPTVLKQIAPPFLSKPRPVKSASVKSISAPVCPAEIASLAQKVTASRQKKYLFFYRHPENNISFFLNLIENFIKKQSQILIVFPEIIDIENFKRRVPEKYQAKTIVIHRRLSSSAYLKNYWLIKNKAVNLILGTPISVFLPFKKLGLIIIDQSENQNHKQYDQNPRFNAKKIAEKMAETTPAKVVFSSVSPDIETFNKTVKNEFKRLNAPPCPGRVKLVDLRKSRSDQAISPVLLDEIKKTLSAKGKLLLFLNRRGFSRSLVCLDCGQTLKCPFCDLPFILHQEGNGYYLLCHRCGRKEKSLSVCPVCRGTRLKNIGIGTEKVESELRVLFPGAKIGRFEEKLPKNLSLTRLDIIITTQLVFKRLDWQKISLIGVVSADTILNLPDYRAQEKTFQQLTRLLSYSLINKNCRLVIQTYHPDNPAIKYFPDQFEIFFRQDLKMRKDYFYPPFSKIAKLTCQHKDSRQALAQARIVYENLIKLTDFSISPPLPAFIFRQYGNFRYQLIIKIPLATPLKSLKDMLKIVPDNWLIDVDPENLL